MADDPPSYPPRPPEYPPGPPVAPPPYPGAPATPYPPAYPPPQFPPPPAAPSGSRKIWLLVVLPVVALLVIGGGLVVVGTFFVGDDGPDHPDEWDPRVADIAAFVEDERGLEFKHPVLVEFLPEEEFVEGVTSSEDDLSDEDREELESDTAELRAMGLVAGDVDLFEESNDLSGEGVAAYYDPEDQLIRVRGEELTPGLRATIAHEVTHALQDQHFDLDTVEESLDPDQALAYRAIVEGDAVGVQNAYVADELSSTEREEYTEEQGDEAEEADIEDVSDVLVAFFSAPYALGPPFVGLVEEVEGESAIDALLRDGPPSEAALMNPQRFFDDVEPEVVDPPTTDEGVEIIDEGSFGALSWFLVLAARVDPAESLTVVDNWAGDSYKTYEQNGRVCLASRYRGSSEEATAEVADLFGEWVDAMPGDVASMTEIDERTLEVRSCDPGTEAESDELNDLVDAMGYPTVRLYLAQAMIDEAQLDFDDAWCVSNEVVAQFSPEDLQGDAEGAASAEVQAAVLAAVRECSRGG